MRILLDTQVLLWAASQPERLSPAARRLLDNPQHDLHFSAASLWEISIKNGLGRADFRVDPGVLRRRLIENGYEELPITSEHAVRVDSLPPLHKDPFDRMLIAQALCDGLTLVTADTTLARYPGPIRSI